MLFQVRAGFQLWAYPVQSPSEVSLKAQSHVCFLILSRSSAVLCNYSSVKSHQINPAPTLHSTCRAWHSSAWCLLPPPSGLSAPLQPLRPSHPSRLGPCCAWWNALLRVCVSVSVRVHVPPSTGVSYTGRRFKRRSELHALCDWPVMLALACLQSRSCTQLFDPCWTLQHAPNLIALKMQ